MTMKFLEEIRELMTDAITKSKYAKEQSACCTFNCDAGYIDLWCDDIGDAEVVIYQYYGLEIEHPLLEEAIFNALPDWDDVEVEYEEPYSHWVRYYGRL